MNREELIELTKNIYRLTLLFPKKEPLRYKIREVADDIVVCFIARKRNDYPYALKENLEIITSFLEIAKSQNWVSPQLSLEIRQEYDRINQELDLEKETLKQEKSQQENKPSEEENREKNKEKLDLGQGKNDLSSNKTSSIQVSTPVFLISEAKSETNKKDDAPDLKREEREEKEEKKERGEGKEFDDILTSQLTSAQLQRRNSIIDYLKQRGQAQVWEIQNIFPKTSKRTIRRDFRLLLKHDLIERVGERNKTYYKLKINVA